MFCCSLIQVIRISGDIGGIEWLKEWLGEMENQLQPLDFRMEWTIELLQFKVGHHKVSSKMFYILL